MFKTSPKLFYQLSALIGLLMLVQSAGGICWSNLYRDNAFVTIASRGNDWVTLIVAVPLLLTAWLLAQRGSIRATLVLFGLLDYTLYNYAFYLFGVAFNWFFLLYVALFALSIYTLIFGLTQLDVASVRQHFGAGVPVRWVGGYMAFVTIGLSCVYVAQSVGFIVTGQLPPIIALSGHPTNIVFALDLSLVVPVMALGAGLLWRRHAWGYVLAIIANVKGAVYMLVLSVNTILVFQAGVVKDLSELALWGVLAITSLLACLFLLIPMRSGDASASSLSGTSLSSRS